MKHSGDPWIASGMKDLNKPHEAPVRAFFERLVQDPKHHAKFLNTLSMLEHMGSRKIMVSQSKFPETMSCDTLQHLAEEARHAYFFKRHAERINGAAMPGWVDGNTMARVPAAIYFGRLDAGISKKLQQMSSPRPEQSEGLNGGDPEKERSDAARVMDPVCAGAPEEARQRDDNSEYDAYGWVSLVIELRACWVYAIFNDVVERAGVHLPLKGLLAEEDHHLEEMFGLCGGNHALLQDLSRYETGLFETFWQALETAYPVSLNKPADKAQAA